MLLWQVNEVTNVGAASMDAGELGKTTASVSNYSELYWNYTIALILENLRNIVSRIQTKKKLTENLIRNDAAAAEQLSSVSAFTAGLAICGRSSGGSIAQQKTLRSNFRTQFSEFYCFENFLKIALSSFENCHCKM